MHYVMHVPRDRWIERTRVFRFLNEHHRLHHKDHNTNLNVVFPLADLLFRTLRTHAMRRQAAAAAKPVESAPAASTRRRRA
jgi:sterol desaturase/sphingolipid hydroxylase (fatty acid hydroxylase superfamily)